MSTRHDRTTADDDVVVQGIGVSPGRVAGPVALMPDPVAEPPAGRRLAPDADVDAAAARLADASRAVEQVLEEAASHAEGEARAVLEATATMATDPTLLADATELVRREHLVPERAVWQAAEAVSAQLTALGGYLAERVRDVEDVRDRLVAHLTGRPAPGIPERPGPFVLVAADLAPAAVATLDPSKVLAIVTAAGGPTSHTAILARSLGIPAVVAAAGIERRVREGAVILVDGGSGRVRPFPTADQLATVRERTSSIRPLTEPGRTADGHPVALLANIGDPSQAAAASETGAEGVGLFRTEFCFLGRGDAPGIDEQVAAYAPVLAAFEGRRVVVRTLDAGADKPLPFLHDPRGESEQNPALGIRGLRTAARSPQVLNDQLAAIARAAAGSTADVWVMAPMVSTPDETEDFVRLARTHGLSTAGVMIEVPSAALCAGPLMSRADFASIGTNDLTQYAMAADRMLGSLAPLADSWQPAVLRLVELACLGGAQQARPVGVCGEAAADPALAVVLVGLGASSLSMTPRALSDVATVLAATDLATCRRLATLALAAESAAQARAIVRAGLPVLDELCL